MSKDTLDISPKIDPALVPRFKRAQKRGYLMVDQSKDRAWWVLEWWKVWCKAYRLPPVAIVTSGRLPLAAIVTSGGRHAVYIVETFLPTDAFDLNAVAAIDAMLEDLLEERYGVSFLAIHATGDPRVSGSRPSPGCPVLGVYAGGLKEARTIAKLIGDYLQDHRKEV
jgi:hypothetical protein